MTVSVYLEKKLQVAFRNKEFYDFMLSIDRAVDAKQAEGHWTPAVCEILLARTIRKLNLEKNDPQPGFSEAQADLMDMLEDFARVLEDAIETDAVLIFS